MQYLVIGMGGVGGYYGIKLANAGREVSFLVRRDAKKIRDCGVYLDSCHGDITLDTLNAFESADEVGKVDVVLVALKETQNSILDTILPKVCHKDTLVILMQNGIGVEEQLAKRFPDTHLAGGLCYICSYKESSTKFVHQDIGKVTIAPYSHSKDIDSTAEKICRAVVDDFNDSNVTAYYSRHLASTRWKKLVWNIPFNGLSVVLNSQTSALVNNSSSEQLVEKLMDEIVEAANKFGAAIEPSYPKEMVEITRNMIDYAPSMLLDYRAGRDLEVDAIFSTPLKLAESVGSSMPSVRVLEQQLKFISTRDI